MGRGKEGRKRKPKKKELEEENKGGKMERELQEVGKRMKLGKHDRWDS